MTIKFEDVGVPTYLPTISMYTTAGVDFSTTSAMKLYLYRGLSGLNGEAHRADWRTVPRMELERDTVPSSTSSPESQSPAKPSPKPSPKPAATEARTRRPPGASRPLPVVLVGGLVSRTCLVSLPTCTLSDIKLDILVIVLSVLKEDPHLLPSTKKTKRLTTRDAILHHDPEQTSPGLLPEYQPNRIKP